MGRHARADTTHTTTTRTFKERRAEQQDEHEGIAPAAEHHVGPPTAVLGTRLVTHVAHDRVGDDVKGTRQGGEERDQGDIGANLGVEQCAVDTNEHGEGGERELRQGIRELDAKRNVAIGLRSGA